MLSFLSSIVAPQPKAAIELFLDNSIVIAGSSITGRVVLSVFAEHIPEERILLQLSGIEHAQYDKPGSGERGGGSVFLNSEFKLLDTTFPLCICPGGFGQGQHTFSFNFVLPANLPPSFSYHNRAPRLNNAKSSCGVSYSLKASLDMRSHGHPPSLRLFGHSPRGFHLKDFGVITPVIDMVPLATCLPVNEYRINYLCCYCSGSISFGAFLPNSVICAGEALDIYYVIENNSKSKVIELSVSIEGNLQYSARTQREVHRLTSVHQSFTETQLVGNLSPKTPPATSGKTIDELTRDLVSGSCGKVSVAIPQSALPSITGKGGFINLDYKVVLTVRTSWGYTKPVLTSGLTIHRNGLQPIYDSLALLPGDPTSWVRYNQELATIY